MKMNDLRRPRLFLVLCIIFTVCQGGQEHRVDCQGSVTKLGCSKKSFVITIVSAIYGRELSGSLICANTNHGSSSDELKCEQNVEEKVKELCQWKRNCTIPVNARTLGEPCPNVYKYLDVMYKCEDEAERQNRQIYVFNLSTSPGTVPPSSTATQRPKTSSVHIQPTPALGIKIQTLTIVHTEQRKQSSSTSSSRSSSDSKPSRSKQQILWFGSCLAYLLAFLS